MDNVRILKGYSKDQQKELKKVKEILRIDDLLHIITGFTQDTRCSLIRQKYDNAEKEEQISIIRDILDFYTDKAKFADQKYYVHLIKGDEYSYLNINSEGGAELGTKFGFGYWKTKFTRDEVAAMNPQLVLFMEEVEK